ncbi:cold-shock protein [Schleiferilactobacillus shenzhenensis]|uniref:CspA n=1 Tax=Schleiferilactobacillus shenzhenensis LY-73 TaxID=1231336 RepID=U4TST1_9LACO|nr:cold shock domain-containing protein [Schleiferilactobacillus shenzhenensis]ERL66485.1 CspA [Schleiferilactobacillus shenzhenensis LY-73]
MLYGTVKSFDEHHGFGFITSPTEGDIFVHFTGIVDAGYKTLHKGQKVQFVVVEGKNGPQAAEVSVVPEDGEQAE